MSQSPASSVDKRHRAFHSARDYETSASQIGDIEPLTLGTKDRARRVVAEQLMLRDPDLTADVLAETLQMLGLHPDQPDWQDDDPTVLPVQGFNNTAKPSSSSLPKGP